jgi:hypothetical protein
LAYRFGCVEQRLGRVSAEGDENLRLDYLNLSLEIGQAAYYFVGAGVAIARGSALQYVAYEDIASLEPAGRDDLVQQLAGPADKWTSLSIFVSPRGFSDEHNAGIGISLARHGIGPRRSQAALAALTDFFNDSLQFGGFVGDGHSLGFARGRAALLIFHLGRCRFTPGGKAGETLLHLKVLANDFSDIHLIFHCPRF